MTDWEIGSVVKVTLNYYKCHYGRVVSKILLILPYFHYSDAIFTPLMPLFSGIVIAIRAREV